MSIDNDKFRALLGAYSESVDSGYTLGSEAREERFIAARRDLVAYIDEQVTASKREASTEPSSTSTSQGAAPEPDDGKCWTDDLACDHCGQIGWHVCNRGNSGAASGDALDAQCGCQACNPHMVGKMMFICPKCGDKRCPHAAIHVVECSAIAASTSKGAKP